MKLFYKMWCFCLAWPLYPLTNFFLPLYFSFFRKRKIFEELNEWDSASNSFREEGVIAKVAFEVSSEGELEQVRPIIHFLLEKKECIELIYCSPSVEKGMQKIYQEHRQQVRLLRLPLLTYRPFHPKRSVSGWMTSPTLILCRYDFFPELMLLGLKQEICFILVSATLKDKVSILQSWMDIRRFYWRSLYKSFNHLWVATPKDKDRLVSFLNFQPEDLFCADFRVLQISDRLSKKNDVLNQHLFFPYFKEWLMSFSKTKRLVLGSYWPKESSLLNDEEIKRKILNKDLCVTVVPHQLEFEAVFESLRHNFHCYFITPHLTTSQLVQLFKDWHEKPGVIILMVKGVLCELYSLFGHAYVGGGFGRSIHSLLEPYLSGCQLYVGPKVYRSTEYDLIRQLSPHELELCSTMAEFGEKFIKKEQVLVDEQLRSYLVDKTKPLFDIFLKQIGVL